MEVDELLWRPLKGIAEGGKKKKTTSNVLLDLSETLAKSLHVRFQPHSSSFPVPQSFCILIL